jgi:transposase
VNISLPLKQILGVDLTKIPSVSEITALEFIAEVGTNMKQWKSAKHFSAWLNLTPNTKITGGKIISSKVAKKKNKAGQTLKMAASSLSNSKAALGDDYRRFRGKHGGKGAALAMAHKLARTIYTLINEKKEYDEAVITKNKEHYRSQKIHRLKMQLEKLEREVA